MGQSHKVREDLGYVRDVVGRAEHSGTPRAIWYLWAVVGFIGFALIDFAPQRVGPYWAVAGPIGFLASAWLGARHARHVGQESVREGYAYMLHWGAMGAAIFLLALLPATGDMTSHAMARVVVLILALSYFLAGVHLTPALKWMGLMMTAGYGLLFFLDQYAWTIVGAIVAVGLIAVAHFTAKRPPRVAATPQRT